ncbi:MAG: conserved hypothetical protein [Candidatus Desulfovibrio kirbyi]|uniref:Uncharacterized protein n=1 Tax=Candidatus Desulfovibrio kirbyi TaxID=2696086 RepID=A0A6L2R5X2_9BACT|nr:MAG: conserved hypothetical protein [Candidatus Desulfovibrio kirbyi]
MSKGFWRYLALWRARFPRRRSLRWRGSWLQNDYCRDCRFCCGPQDSGDPFYMALLPEQIRPNLSEDFYLFDRATAFMDARGCKAATERGCRLERVRRPPACGIFPLVLANGCLYLYKICPAVLLTPIAAFAEIGLEAARRLAGLRVEDARHISLGLSVETLARSYISLDIRIFDEKGMVECPPLEKRETD